MEIPEIRGDLFGTVRIKCPQCQTVFNKDDILIVESAPRDMLDVYCPICEKLWEKSEFRVEKGEITRKSREYIRRQKLTRIQRPK